MKAEPFIKWAGGKRGLLKQILPLFPKKFKNYHEPFLGGGAVFFKLYSLGYLKDKEVYLSDINSELINAYKVVRDNPIDLISNLKKYKEKHSKDFYYEIRALDREEDFLKLSELERATRFIYLNKTCFNGLYRVNKKGHFNTPIGTCKSLNTDDKNIILNASKALQNVTIINQSFEKVIPNSNKNDLVYFDPPYYPLNKTSDFTRYDIGCFSGKDHYLLYEVFDMLSIIGIKAVLSNSNTDFIRNLYKKYDISYVTANRFINSKGSGRGKIKEVIIRSKI